MSRKTGVVLTAAVIAIAAVAQKHFPPPNNDVISSGLEEVVIDELTRDRMVWSELRPGAARWNSVYGDFTNNQAGYFTSQGELLAVCTRQPHDCISLSPLFEELGGKQRTSALTYDTLSANGALRGLQIKAPAGQKDQLETDYLAYLSEIGKIMEYYGNPRLQFAQIIAESGLHVNPYNPKAVGMAQITESNDEFFRRFLKREGIIYETFDFVSQLRLASAFASVDAKQYGFPANMSAYHAGGWVNLPVSVGQAILPEGSTMTQLAAGITFLERFPWTDNSERQKHIHDNFTWNYGPASQAYIDKIVGIMPIAQHLLETTPQQPIYRYAMEEEISAQTLMEKTGLRLAELQILNPNLERKIFAGGFVHTPFPVDGIGSEDRFWIQEPTSCLKEAREMYFSTEITKWDGSAIPYLTRMQEAFLCEEDPDPFMAAALQRKINELREFRREVPSRVVFRGIPYNSVQGFIDAYPSVMKETIQSEAPVVYSTLCQSPTFKRDFAKRCEITTTSVTDPR